MKFNCFHLMPYQHLPADFEERFSSPSLTFPNGYFDPARGVELYHRYLDELELADVLGFDGIAVNEHHQSAYGLMPSPNIMAAALARRTSKAQLMVLGNAIGLRSNPLQVAEEIAMLDHLSRGRVVSGFVRGIGWEYFGHSVNPTRSRERFEEAHDLIIKAWTTREPFQWVGRNYEFRYVNVWPRPLQDPHPRIYVPGAGSSETMRWVAERDYTYMSVYAPVSVIKRWFDGYRAAAEAAGRAPNPERIVFSVPIYVAETDERAHAEARGPTEWLFHKGLKQGPEIVFPPGYMSASSMRGLLTSGMSGFAGLSYEDLLRERMMIAGSADSVGAELERLRDELGFGALNLLFCIGDMPHDHVVTSMQLFASQVMPAFRRVAV